MDLRNPLRVVAPTLDADVLNVLAHANAAFTGREVHRLAARGSQDGVRLVLRRLTDQGIVTRERAGRANLYRLNRDHLAAPYVVALATLRLELIEKLRGEIAVWDLQPVAAALFGSIVRGEADESSDVDLLVVRPAGMDEDATEWRRQLETLAAQTTRWTGNDARLLEYAAEELDGIRAGESPLLEASRHGVVLAGSATALRTGTAPRRD